MGSVSPTSQGVHPSGYVLVVLESLGSPQSAMSCHPWCPLWEIKRLKHLLVDNKYAEYNTISIIILQISLIVVHKDITHAATTS
mmetsp:Transcript_30406/g.73346  ORF Transcript_30406/g.73346 Transcript_30406/m.73346 type:complete len:84 (-) Transcript_30406:1052-1303(-)